MAIASNWKNVIVSLLAGALLAALWPAFSAQGQNASVLALVRGRGATLYAQPGGDPLRTLLPGDRLDATGRTEDALWIVGAVADGTQGWLRVEDVILYDLLALPVVEGVAAPASQPTDAPTLAATQAAPAAVAVSPTVTATATATATPSPTPTVTSSPTAIPSPTPLVAPKGGAGATGIVRGGGAELLAAAGGEVLASAATGDPLTVVGRSGDGGWLLAIDAAGVIGWVERGRVVIFGVESLPVVALPPAGEAPATAPETPLATATGVLTGTVVTDGIRLNVRSGPGTAYPIVAKVQDGVVLSLLARDEESAWVQVPLETAGFGWVSAAFLASDGAIDALPVSDALSDAAPLAAPAPLSPAQTTPSTAPSPSALPGKLALAAADGSIVLYELGSGQARRLTGGFDPAISPDGSKIAFLRGGEGLFVIDADGGNERRLYGGGEEMRAPTWSPDGQLIAFSRVNGQDTCRSLGFGICLPDNPQLTQYPLVRKDLRTLSRVDLNGENFQDIPTLDTATAPSWTTAGVVYQSNSGLQITQDGSERDKEGNLVNRALTKEYLHRDPVWRPDGGRVALMDANPNHQEIYAINPDGSGLTALTRPASALSKTLPHNVAPAWSPDGQRIAFLSNRDGAWAVYVMDADGGNQRRLDVGVEMGYRFQNEQVIAWGK